MPIRILLAEDDQAISMGLEYALCEAGYQVDSFPDLPSAREAVFSGGYDLYLLDISLPGGNGYELCRLVREREREAPSRSGAAVIFLTALDDEGSVVMGLDMGADDYITKPFRLRELQSRIQSVLRRSGRRGEESSGGQPVIRLGEVEVNTSRAQVRRHGAEVALTALEYRLFLTFLNNRGRVLSRSQLLEAIWDVEGDFVNDNTLTVYIKRLRDKLEDNPAAPVLIKTVRGMGYLMEEGSYGAK